MLDADSAGARDLLSAEDAQDKKDVGRNGTYLVMRQLRQDVRSFWQFVHQQSSADSVAAEKLAAAFVGRTRAGDPLVPMQEQPIPGIGPDPDQVRQNQFTFARDPMGVACPLARMSIARIAKHRFWAPDRLAKLITMLGFGPDGFRDDLMSGSLSSHLRRGRE